MPLPETEPAPLGETPSGAGSRHVGVATPAVRAHHLVALGVLALLTAGPLLLVVLPLGRIGERGDPLVVALSWSVLLYSALRLASFCWRASVQWASALFWAFSYVWLGLASLAQTMSGLNPMSTPLGDSTVVVQLSMILLGFLAFDVGRKLTFRGRLGRLGDLVRRSPPWELSRGRVIALSVLTIGVSPVFVAVLGGPAVLFSSRQAVDDQLTGSALYTGSTNASGGTIVVLANILPFVSALAILCLWRARPVLRRDVTLLALFGALLLVNGVLNNPISNARYWFFAIVIAGLLSLPVLHRPATRAAFIALYILAATLVFPYADAFRTDDVGAQATTQSTSRPVDFLVGKTDYGSVTDVGIAVRYVEDHGHTLGRQLLGAATFWVPRNWWPDKPVNSAELLADQANFPNRNLDTPLWAEGYLDFGFAGTVALLLGFGALAARMDRVIELVSADGSRAANLAFPVAVSVVGYESFLLRGSLLQAMAKIVFLVLALALLGTRRRSPVAGPVGVAAPATRSPADLRGSAV